MVSLQFLGHIATSDAVISGGGPRRTPNCFFDTAVVDSITLSCHRITMVVLDEVPPSRPVGFLPANGHLPLTKVAEVLDCCPPRHTCPGHSG